MDTFLLLVVPPEAGRNSAQAALDESATGIAGARPEEILAACGISTAPAAADGEPAWSGPAPPRTKQLPLL
jgi:hypothetical protein